ncbi:tRNA synthetases class I-domain-containing protein [Mycena floridula]|nr:tRNA synthetases class I-domain-containing protein [Mycena floridula]
MTLGTLSWSIKRNIACSRILLNRAVCTDNKAFTKSLLLPNTSFTLWSKPAQSEVPFHERTTENLYRWQWKNVQGPLFVLHDGPPYANGDLHMGHALNKIVKDIICRFQLSQGRRVHYIPGWDCHGLPIENKALQELKQDSTTITTSDLRAAARETALRESASQKYQFQQFGIMADWSKESTYRTLDHEYEMRQLELFQTMVEKGLIYRNYRPVHYSPSSRSALAEAELEYVENHVSHSVFVAFQLDATSSRTVNSQLQEHISASDEVQLLVWTTTPWTLTANMAIAVHPAMKYSLLSSNGVYMIVASGLVEAVMKKMDMVDVPTVTEILGSELLDLRYKPIFSSLLAVPPDSQPVIPSQSVTADSGTGLVHTAPAHAAEDYSLLKTTGFSQTIICHVGEGGVFSDEIIKVAGDIAGPPLVGKPVLEEGSRAIVELLKTVGALKAIQRYKHKYPYDWRTKKPVIVTATSQWFANLDGIKDNALKALEDVQFYPASSRTRLESFINNRSEWCISRQRVWGVPIPSLHHGPSESAILDADSMRHILGVLRSKGLQYWWDGPVEDFIPPQALEKYPTPAEVPLNQAWRKGTDTMDVWFDSGTSWTMLPTMGVGQGPARKFHADVCLEGSDQHRGWFQSQLLTAVSTSDEAISPYASLITHGMVLDESGKKMSKSLGNVISPMTVISGGQNKKLEPEYGASILRLWVATMDYKSDMSIGKTVLAQTSESLRRLRNSARFMLGNIGDARPVEKIDKSSMGLAERYVMSELYDLEQVALDGYARHNFHIVMTALIKFSTFTLSSLYFDINKDRLYADDPKCLERRAVVSVLDEILSTTTSILAPVLPHLAEEIHQSRHGQNTELLSFFMTPWKPLDSKWSDPEAKEDMNSLIAVRTAVLALLEKARGQKHLNSSLEAEVEILIPSEWDGSPEEIEASEKFAALLQREEDFLKTLFIVSDARLTDEGSLGTSSSPSWLFVSSLDIPGGVDGIAIRVRPATKLKCPRCWTYTRPEESELCERCCSLLGETSLE